MAGDPPPLVADQILDLVGDGEEGIASGLRVERGVDFRCSQGCAQPGLLRLAARRIHGAEDCLHCGGDARTCQKRAQRLFGVAALLINPARVIKGDRQ